MGQPPIPPSLPGPGSRSDQTLSLNMRLVAHHELQGFGGIGEGMALQLTRDQRRILWLAHESAPKNFTGVDVTDPRAPRVLVQTELPHAEVRSNSLDVVGDVMAVAYQTQTTGLTPAGFELFDIGVPELPRLISHFDASGPHSRGVHALWFVDGEFVHMASGAADFQPRHPFDDQFYRIADVRNPSHPVEVSRWWLPGTREGHTAPPPPPLPTPHSRGAAAASARTTCTRICPCPRRGPPTRSSSAHSSTPAFARTTSAIRSGHGKWRISFRARLRGRPPARSS